MDLTFILLIALGCLLIGFALASLFYSLRTEKQVKPLAPAERHEAEGPASTAQDANKVEMARLWYDKPRSAMAVEIDGRTYYTASDLDPAHMKKIDRIVEELRAWKGTKRVFEQPAAAAANVKPVSPAPLNALIGRSKPDRPSAVASLPKSLAEQVDEILQEMIEGTPLISRGIRLMDSPDQGIRVIVGYDKYDGIDTVPDEEIRSAIREAVKEWERRAIN